MPGLKKCSFAVIFLQYRFILSRLSNNVRRGGRAAEGNGLLNRRMGKHPYRGFESRPLRYIDDSKCQDTPKPAENKEVTATSTEDSIPSNRPSKLPNEDRANTIKVTNSDKLDNKQNNKPEADRDLAEVIKAWPQIPSAIRSAIVAIVRSSKE